MPTLTAVKQQRSKRHAALLQIVPPLLRDEPALIKLIRRLNREALEALEDLATLPECSCKPEWVPCTCEEVQALCERLGIKHLLKLQFQFLYHTHNPAARAAAARSILAGTHRLCGAEYADDLRHEWGCNCGHHLVPCKHANDEPEITLPPEAEREMLWRLSHRYAEPPAPDAPSEVAKGKKMALVMSLRAGILKAGGRAKRGLRHKGDLFARNAKLPERLTREVRNLRNGSSVAGKVGAVKATRGEQATPFPRVEIDAEATPQDIHRARLAHALRLDRNPR